MSDPSVTRNRSTDPRTSSPAPKWLDLRRIIGVQLAFYGILLAVYGLIASPTTASTRWNMDFYWGLVVCLVGAVFLLASLRPPRTED